MRAAVSGIAGIIGAIIAVVASECASTHADSLGADIGGRAGVAIIASFHVVRVNTAAGRIARVVGAPVVVIAVRRRTTHARATRARVRDSAGVPVVTRVAVVGMSATADGIASIVGADVAVVARPCVVRVGAAGAGIAGIIGADVAVVAIRCGSAYADSLGAGIGGRASVTVFASFRVVRVNTAGGRIAGIIGTLVAVIAVRRGTTHAASIRAGIASCASISIFARGAVGIDGRAVVTCLVAGFRAVRVTVWPRTRVAG